MCNRLTTNDLLNSLLSINIQDTLNIKGFEPNWRGRTMIGDYRVTLSVEQDFSHYGYRRYDWFMRLEVQHKHALPFQSHDYSWRLTYNYPERAGVKAFKIPSVSTVLRRIIRFMRRALSEYSLKEVNGKYCRAYKDRYKILLLNRN